MRGPADKAAASAKALLTAHGFKPGNTRAGSPPIDDGQLVIAERTRGNDEAIRTCIKVRASAYDEDEDTYVYCGTPAYPTNNDTYMLVKEDDVQEQSVDKGQIIKLQVCEEVVLTTKIKDIRVNDGKFCYYFDFEKPSEYYFSDAEILDVLAKSVAAEELEQRTLGRVARFREQQTMETN